MAPACPTPLICKPACDACLQVALDAEAIQAEVRAASLAAESCAEAGHAVFGPATALLQDRVGQAQALLRLLLPVISPALRDRHWSQILGLLESVSAWPCRCAVEVHMQSGKQKSNPKRMLLMALSTAISTLILASTCLVTWSPRVCACS